MRSQKIRRRPESCHAYHPQENAHDCGGASAASPSSLLFLLASSPRPSPPDDRPFLVSSDFVRGPCMYLKIAKTVDRGLNNAELHNMTRLPSPQTRPPAPPMGPRGVPGPQSLRIFPFPPNSRLQKQKKAKNLVCNANKTQHHGPEMSQKCTFLFV
ncbi:hypothetical protein NQD34_009213 [Periophthalmus magnuspinnatus]|nr:hypothetical protein NQD34_009213 [Periophthalmus magnuspinnatus]